MVNIKTNPRLKKAKEQLEEAEYHAEYWEGKWDEINDLIKLKRKEMYQKRKAKLKRLHAS
jgi:hypothetical protein